jgi:hypothetical protein
MRFRRGVELGEHAEQQRDADHDGRGRHEQPDEGFPAAVQRQLQAEADH